VDRCCAPATVWPAIFDTFLQPQENVPFLLLFFLGLLLSWRVPVMAGQFFFGGQRMGFYFLAFWVYLVVFF
jgi:hypothetical protein